MLGAFLKPGIFYLVKIFINEKTGGSMFRMNRVVSIVVLVCFLFNVAVSDLAFGQALNYRPNTDKLAPPSKLSGIGGEQGRQILKITQALQEQLKAIDAAGKLITPATLRDERFFKERSDVQVFRHEIRPVSDEGILIIKVRVDGLKTYYAAISVKKDATGEFSIRVHEAEEPLIESLVEPVEAKGAEGAESAEGSVGAAGAFKDFKAYPDRLVEGASLWVPVKSLSEPLEPRYIGGATLPRRVSQESLRTQEDVLKLVAQYSPEVVGMQRFIDIGGSSIDLRALQKLLTKAGINALDLLTSTTIVAGDFPLSLKMGIADSVNGFGMRDVIQYVINYGKWEGGKIVEKTKTYTVVIKAGKMYTCMQDGSLRSFLAEEDGEYAIWSGGREKRKKGQVIDGQMGAFAYFMSQVNAFGVKGTFKTLQPIAEAGGLGRSGGSNAMFIAMAGILSGVALTKADIQAEAVEKEGNGEDDALAILGGYTGGQESGATLQGLASQMIHLTEIMDASGAYIWPVGTELVVPLAGSKEEVDRRMLSRVALVQAGLPFKDGVAQIKRTAGGINTAWCARAKYPEDIEGRKLHAQKTLVAMVAAYGVAHDRWDLVVWSQNEHRRLRNELDKGFYAFAIQALEKKEDRPAFADVYLKILQDDPILNRYLQYHIAGKDDHGRDFDLRKMSLYSMTQEPLIEAVTEVIRKATGQPHLQLTDRDSPAAVFIPGAGGTGAPAVIVAKTPKLLQNILEKVEMDNAKGGKAKLERFDADNVLKTMGGTGLLQGYLQPKAGDAIKFDKLPEGAKPPRGGYTGVYDQGTGEFYIDEAKSGIQSEVLALPRVKLLSDHPDVEITRAIAIANKAGLQIPTNADKRYNLLVTSEFFANGELKKHQQAYGDRFNVDAVSGNTADQFIENVLRNPNAVKDRTIVLLPDELATGKFEEKHFQALKEVGIRFIITNRNELLKAKTDKDAYRAQFQQDTYAVMLLVRSIDNTITADSPIYRLLDFYLKTHFSFTEGIAIDDYIMAIANNDVLRLIKGCLIYRPAQPYDTPDYKNVAAPLMSV